MKREEVKVIKPDSITMRSSQSPGLEKHETRVTAPASLIPRTPVTVSPPVIAAEPTEASPTVTLPLQSWHSPKALRSAMSSMAKAVVRGRRKPGNPSTV
jgi:hypothetical protein